MNNVFLTCKIDKISELGFDYYNMNKTYYILICSEIYKTKFKNKMVKDNVFKVILYGDMCKKYDLNEKESVYVIGNMVLLNNNCYILANEIYYID